MGKRLLTIFLIVVIIIIFILYIYFAHVCTEKIYDYKKIYKINNNIPNIIYRSHRSRIVPVSMAEYCHRKWVLLNPEYSVLWMDDKDCDNFMRKMGDKIYNAYDKIKPGAFKSDLWRACLLYTYGGIYVDSYTMPYYSLEYITFGCWNENKNNNSHQFISAKDVNHLANNGKLISGIHNGFIIASKNHPYLKRYITDIVNNIENNYYGEHFLDVTGPFCLMRSINKVNNFHVDKLPKIGWNKGKYPFYLFKFKLDINQHISKNGKNIMAKKYSLISFFYEKIIRRNKVYSKMWFDRDIYK